MDVGHYKLHGVRLLILVERVLAFWCPASFECHAFCNPYNGEIWPFREGKRVKFAPGYDDRYRARSRLFSGDGIIRHK